MVILFSTKCFLFVYIYIDLLKLKAYKLFKNDDADLSWLLFSSPEHEVLMVSYWDSAVSGVRRPSSVVRRASCVVRRPSSTFYLVYALEATVLVGYS